MFLGPITNPPVALRWQGMRQQAPGADTWHAAWRTKQLAFAIWCDLPFSGSSWGSPIICALSSFSTGRLCHFATSPILRQTQLWTLIVPSKYRFLVDVCIVSACIDLRMATVMEGFSPKPGTMNASGLFATWARIGPGHVNLRFTMLYVSEATPCTSETRLHWKSSLAFLLAPANVITSKRL